MPSPKEAPSAANGERRSFMRKHVWAISIRRTFRVLQRFIAALARTDAHYTLYIIDEYLSVADMTREERLARSIHDRLHRDFADYNFHFDLGQQVHIHLDTAIVLCRTLFDSAAQHLRDGDARYADLCKRRLQFIEFRLFGQDHDFGDLALFRAFPNVRDRDRFIEFSDICAQPFRIKHFRRQGNGRKIRIGTDKPVFILIEAFDRSAIAPDTIVAVVAQNTRLKKKLDQSYVAKFVMKSTFGTPMSPNSASSPIRSPAPSRTNTTVHA